MLESTLAKHRKARAVGFNHVALEVGDIEQALAQINEGHVAALDLRPE